MVYPFNRNKELPVGPPLPQDPSTRVDAARFSEAPLNNGISLNSNSKSETVRDREQGHHSSNSLERKHPPLWINPLFVSSIKNEIIPKIPYGLGLIGSAFLGMIFQPPVVPIFKHLPHATNAFMQVMRAEEQPIRGGTNAEIERFKEMQKEQYYLALEQNRQLRRLQKQGNSSFSHNSKPSQGLSVPENRNSLQKSPPFSPADQAIIGEFMADKERLQLLCDSFVFMAHSLSKLLRDSAVKARKGPRFDMGMVGFGGMKKDFDTPLAGPRPPTTAGQFDNAAAGVPPSKSLKPLGLFGLYAKWSWFRF